MNKRKTYFPGIFKVFVVITFLIIFANSCSKPNEKPDGRDKISLRLQWFHTAQFAGFYLAKDMGFYKENNLDVEINPGGPDFNAITLIANDSDTFGVWTADMLLIAQSKAVPIKILAAIYREDPNVLMVKPDSGINSPIDFKGKRITTVFGRSTETVLSALLKKENIKVDDVSIEPFPFNLQSFLMGKVDISAAYSYDHPYQARKAGQEVKIIRPADYGIKFYSDCIFARNDFIEKNPEIVQRFVSASLKGWEFALANKNEAVEIVLKYATQLDMESQSYMMQEIEPLIRSENPSQIGLVSLESIQSMVKILQDQKQLPQDFDASKAFTNRFVEEYYEKK